MKVYFAGKIETAWRDELEIKEEVYRYEVENGKVLKPKFNKEDLAIEKFTGLYYHGPYLYRELYPDEMKDWDCSYHGLGNDQEYGLPNKGIFNLCLDSLMDSDVVFCYLNGDEPYGTIFELGVAFAKEIPVYLYIEKDSINESSLPEMWFAMESATQCVYVDNVAQAKADFVQKNAQRLTTKQKNYLDNLIKDFLFYWDVLNLEQTSICYDEFAASNLYMRFGRQLIALNIEINEFFEFCGLKASKTFKTQARAWKKALTRKRLKADELDSFLETLKAFTCILNDKKLVTESITLDVVALKEKLEWFTLTDEKDLVFGDIRVSEKQKVAHEPTKVVIEHPKMTSDDVISPVALLKVKQPTESLILEALKQSKEAVHELKPSFVLKDGKELEALVQLNGLMLKHIPLKDKTEQLCQLAFQSNPMCFPSIPKKFQTQAMCEEALRVSAEFFGYIDLPFRTPEMCLKAYDEIDEKKRKDFLKKTIDEAGYLKILEVHPLALKSIPLKKRTKTLCDFAFQSYPSAELFSSIPSHLRTPEFCEEAFRLTAEVFPLLNPTLQTQKMCKEAIAFNPDFIQYVRLDLMSEM